MSPGSPYLDTSPGAVRARLQRELENIIDEGFRTGTRNCRHPYHYQYLDRVGAARDKLLAHDAAQEVKP